MLNDEERTRLANINKKIDLEASGVPTFDISMGDVQWLATKLLETDTELRAVYTSTIDKLASTSFVEVVEKPLRNPISVMTKDGVKTAAIWDKVPGVYRCIFCDSTNWRASNAQIHANSHFTDRL